MSALRLAFKNHGTPHEVCWRWTLTAPNGRIVGASTESYRKRIDAVKNAAMVIGISVVDIRRTMDPNDPRSDNIARFVGPSIRARVDE